MFSRFVFIILLSIVLASNSFAWTTPEPVSGINTLAKEGEHCISADGQTIYFGRVTNNVFRLYYANKLSDGTFGSGTMISGIYSASGGNVAAPWISADNKRLYYYAREYSHSLLKVATRDSINDSWTNGINIPELNQLGEVAGCTLSSDELTMVFNSTNMGGSGLTDLFIATRDSKTAAWDNVRNLSEINSNGYDAGASLSSDGLTLYFSRINAAGNIGQIFKTSRTSITGYFGSLELLPFSSDYSAPSISADGTALYLGVNPGQLGNWDIHVSYIPEPATLALFALGLPLLRSKKYKIS